jgi:hypothetical protein
VDDLELDLPTGALIAGDAATVFADARPLVEGLPTGRFPARLEGADLEVLLAEAEPVAWSELAAFATPSGYAALLDAAALAEYTDLGDEPVDEFELLSERFGGNGNGNGNGAGGSGHGSNGRGGDGDGAPARDGETDGAAALFRDVLALRGGTGSAALRLGRDADGLVCRIRLRFTGGSR